MTLPRRLILPPNDSALERALAEAMAVPEDIAAIPARLEDRFERPADEELPFLIWEWGLQPVMPYLTDPRRALAEGRPWHKVRGTIPAGHIARGWIDVSAEFEAEANKNYHLHLTELVIGDRLEAVINLSRLSNSLRSKLYRLTYNYDIRAVRGGGRSKMALSIFGADSGHRMTPDGPILSFVDYRLAHAAAVPELRGGLDVLLGSVARRHMKIVFGVDKAGSRQEFAPPDQALPSIGLKARAGARQRGQMDVLRPIASAWAGHGRFADWQSVFIGLRPVEGGGLKIGFPFGSKVDAPGWERVYRIPDPIERVLKAAGKGALNTGPAQTVGALATSPPPRFAGHKARKSPHGQAVSPGEHIAGTGLVPSAEADRHLAASVRGAQTRFADWQSRFAYLVPVQASHARFATTRFLDQVSKPHWLHLAKVPDPIRVSLALATTGAVNNGVDITLERTAAATSAADAGQTVSTGGAAAVSKGAPVSGLTWSPDLNFSPPNPVGLFAHTETP